MDSQPGFHDLGLSQPVLRALDDVGYETPSPIQAQIIPHVLAGTDVVGQAQTGTGKTAAFAMPLLSTLDLKQHLPQVLVLTPTRELAIQVAEAFQRYAGRLRGFHVVPIYGGQDYGIQLRQLRRGVHVVVGTPGRVMDHIRRGTLVLKGITSLVLDEGDEMLRMGFIDDVEWILEQTPAERQISLFSATMPDAIRKIAKKYLRKPEQITVKVRTTTADTINQRFWMVSGLHKLDALTRILEAEPFDAMLVFVRTRNATVELSEKLEARGYASAPHNGEIPQKKRERTVALLKAGKIDILVATDVAARGLDVERISHVINYDIPYDTEAYVHRIGRTGRAGRSGEAILFVQPRERRMLRSIEQATRQRIEMMKLPSTEDINDQRVARFKQRITDVLAVEELGPFYQMVEQYRQEHNIPALEIAAALAKLVQGGEPLLLPPRARQAKPQVSEKPKPIAKPRPAPKQGVQQSPAKHAPKPARSKTDPEVGMERFRIEVGRTHGVKPSNIVGAIINEAGLDGEYVGHIEILEDHSTVDLPEGMPREIFRVMKKVWVSGQQMQISRLGQGPEKGGDKKKKQKHKGKGRKKM